MPDAANAAAWEALPSYTTPPSPPRPPVKRPVVGGHCIAYDRRQARPPTSRATTSSRHKAQYPEGAVGGETVSAWYILHPSSILHPIRRERQPPLGCPRWRHRPATVQPRFVPLARQRQGSRLSLQRIRVAHAEEYRIFGLVTSYLDSLALAMQPPILIPRCQLMPLPPVQHRAVQCRVGPSCPVYLISTGTGESAGPWRPP
jgi:hypothetical protein